MTVFLCSLMNLVDSFFSFLGFSNNPNRAARILSHERNTKLKPRANFFMLDVINSGRSISTIVTHHVGILQQQLVQTTTEKVTTLTRK